MYVVAGSGFFVWRIFLSIEILFAMWRVVTTPCKVYQIPIKFRLTQNQNVIKYL